MNQELFPLRTRQVTRLKNLIADYSTGGLHHPALSVLQPSLALSAIENTENRSRSRDTHMINRQALSKVGPYVLETGAAALSLRQGRTERVRTNCKQTSLLAASSKLGQRRPCQAQVLWSTSLSRHTRHRDGNGPEDDDFLLFLKAASQEWRVRSCGLS